MRSVISMLPLSVAAGMWYKYFNGHVRVNPTNMPVRTFCSRKSGQQKLKRAILQSFEQEMQSDVQEIQKLGKDVKAEIDLAAAHAERQDQRLQAQERKNATRSRSRLRSFMPKVERGLDEIRAMQLQQSTRKSSEYISSATKEGLLY